MTSKKEKNVKNLLKRGKFEEAIDCYNEIAHGFQRDRNFQKALEFCEKGSELAREHHKYFEGTFCERQLSEIHAELGNRESCLQHLSEFRRLSIKSASRSQEQLSFHVESWCFLQLYQNGSADVEDIRKAIQTTEKSRKMVDQYKLTFKESDPGGSAKIRKAQLFILEAQLEAQLENNSTAMELLDKAKNFLSVNDKSIWYELRRTQCSVAPVGRRIDIAELMEDEAPEDKKAQALVELSHLYTVSNRLQSGYKKLAMVYVTHGKHLNPNEYEEVSKRLGILYRLVKYTKLLQNPKSTASQKLSKCELYEAIGDLFDKYYQSMMEKEKKEYRHFVKENILKNYEMMLENKRNEDDVLRAYLAMALVYGDLEEYGKSLDLFTKRLHILEDNGAGEEKIIDTRLSIFNCQCKLGHLDVESNFEDLKSQVSMDHHKKELFDVWATYWADHQNSAEEKKWREIWEQIPDVYIKNEDDETDVLFGRISEEEILERVVNENSLLKLETMSEYQLKKTNDKGETILHQEAQVADNEQIVEKLCKLGCDVNAKDNGGWTPLSEAVAHDEVGNARVLLRYGADVNSRSVESFVCGEETPDSGQNHSGLTPLMEASTNGFVRMARLLIEHKAKVELKDSVGWTAYDHLRRYIAENEPTEELTKLEEYLRSETKKSGNSTVAPTRSSQFMTRPSTSSHQKKRLSDGFDSGRNQMMGDMEIEDDSPPDVDEEMMILDSVASRKRPFSSQSSENLVNISKRRPRSGETSRPVTKNQPPRVPIFNTPRPVPLRRSYSPRNSVSPTTTIRSAPSVFGDLEDVQFMGVQRRTPRSSISPRKASPQMAPPPRQFHPPPPPPRTTALSENSDVLPLKCVFEVPDGSNQIQSVILPLKKTLTIGETKQQVMEQIDAGHLRMSTVYKKDDGDKCILADQLQLCHVADTRNNSLVFRLTAPPAHEIYESISKAPIPEVTERLKQLSCDIPSLDLSELFIDENEVVEVLRTLNKCERPDKKMRITVEQCELSSENEPILKPILENCNSLKICSSSGFFGAFQHQSVPLETLEIVCCDFRDETQLVRVLKCCPMLKNLKLSGIQMKSRRNSIGGPGGMGNAAFSEAIGDLSELKSLDLSGYTENSWISDENWIKILSKCDKLEVLTINDTVLTIEFQSYWLSSLISLNARGSALHWDSLAEMLSVAENIDRIDLRFTEIDENLVEELKKRDGITVLT